MQADLFGNAALRERFRNEARVTAEVRSEHLVDVFDAGVDAATGTPFLVMELLIGEDLGRRVERAGPLSPAEVVRYLGQVASALDKTHARSIVHRDLKPANLFLAELEDGSVRVKILDFGISKVVSEAMSEGATSHTLGTPAYMAPEQLLGEPVSARTDIHALGLIAYALLVGESYWQEDVESVDNVFAFALRAQEGPRESPLERAARRGRPLPPAFAAWFERATARDPEARFARASEAMAALGAALGVRASVPPPAVSQGMSVDAPSIPGERSLLSGVRRLVVPAALLAALGVYLVFRDSAESPPRAPGTVLATPNGPPRVDVAVPSPPAPALPSITPTAGARAATTRLPIPPGGPESREVQDQGRSVAAVPPAARAEATVVLPSPPSGERRAPAAPRPTATTVHHTRD
jgi:serine/threonine-protein kinase